MGEQVADNTEMQYTTTLKRNSSGGFYVETNDRTKRGLVKKEYIPVGKTLVYPKKWGKTKGSLELVNHHIQVEEDIIKQANDNLESLQKLKKGIEDIGIN